MDIYLVGGAVRDALLGLPVVDRDYVVVGALPEQLLQQGYQQVGKDFPVFLHPKSKDEYALARTERKSGSGYNGFICDFGPNITLEEDLSRRDLTINAIAQDENGMLFDPYGGQADLDSRTLRHVSDAFSEDPLRVLRVARFAARFHHLGFRVANDTLTLMRQIAASGELSALTPERVWKETEKALACEQPQVFFEVLRSCNALNAMFPELEKLFSSTEAHALQALWHGTQLTTELACRFAALTLQLDVAALTALCERSKVPTEHKELALLSSRWHQRIHALRDPNRDDAEQILALFQATDSWRRPERFAHLLLCAQADWQASIAFDSSAVLDSSAEPYPQRAQLWHWFKALQAITAGPFVAQGLKGPAIGEAIKQARLVQLQQWLA
ncbi:multifunctional CCA tRNA nucleotidyl transferase/2'3'-cyclic phosphodiesterase/2'nucleotidase/phosphatase [Oceanisphaera profunda]|uniref:CCA-adding enzyme n=1 Tax=Oceanisphaera profunda TaxID=1416627 RepID=A0A1Y0D4E5_9GAMM|nr:multifunctional CCA tRNA nucleotidyl transferase/2'3'-cyclic phosphodiesterase/2'nucleotidase/phosphatase [Oceanisphaera profunda]ART82087.1 multifunctional CCA tRNA nucleotidyl transferase/2'3'-cyclic phosphodiesterase/2'nucleotidase/phosphatase [Oceanisphaera profunda]